MSKCLALVLLLATTICVKSVFVDENEFCTPVEDMKLAIGSVFPFGIGSVNLNLRGGGAYIGLKATGVNVTSTSTYNIGDRLAASAVLAADWMRTYIMTFINSLACDYTTVLPSNTNINIFPGVFCFPFGGSTPAINNLQLTFMKNATTQSLSGLGTFIMKPIMSASPITTFLRNVNCVLGENVTSDDILWPFGEHRFPFSGIYSRTIPVRNSNIRGVWFAGRVISSGNPAGGPSAFEGHFFTDLDAYETDITVNMTSTANIIPLCTRRTQFLWNDSTSTVVSVGSQRYYYPGLSSGVSTPVSSSVRVYGGSSAAIGTYNTAGFRIEVSGGGVVYNGTTDTTRSDISETRRKMRRDMRRLIPQYQVGQIGDPTTNITFYPGVSIIMCANEQRYSSSSTWILNAQGNTSAVFIILVLHFDILNGFKMEYVNGASEDGVFIVGKVLTINAFLYGSSAQFNLKAHFLFEDVLANDVDVQLKGTLTTETLETPTNANFTFLNDSAPLHNVYCVYLTQSNVSCILVAFSSPITPLQPVIPQYAQSPAPTQEQIQLGKTVSIVVGCVLASAAMVVIVAPLIAMILGWTPAPATNGLVPMAVV